MSNIKKILAREIKDSRNKPTIQVEVTLDDDVKASASVPSGASTGAHEAKTVEVPVAIANVNSILNEILIGFDASKQVEIDQIMIDRDGTPDKSKLGANAILPVSLAVSRASAKSQNIPLYQYIRNLINPNISNDKIPIPMFNIINGGKHAQNNIDFQEFMIVPTGFPTFAEQLAVGQSIFLELRRVLEKYNLNTNIGDEGGYAPDLDTNEQAFGLMEDAIRQAGFAPGKQVFLALDVAASSLPPTFQLDTKLYLSMIENFPIISIEDPLPEDDWHWWGQLKLEIEKNNKTGRRILIIGDDLFVTNLKRLDKGINELVANSILIKTNQVGTLSETLDVIRLARQNEYTLVISHRSGETLDSYIADLAFGSDASYIKAGAPNPQHQERMVKYQRLVEIEQEILKRR